MGEPYNSLYACEYGELNSHTPVWNLSASDDTIYVKLPYTFSSYVLYKVDDITCGKSSEVNIFDNFYQDLGHLWISFPRAIFNMNPGKHTYKLYFIDKCNQSHSLFISYVCQDDDPMTPYIYMKDRGNTSSEDNEWKQGKYAQEYFNELNAVIEKEYPDQVHSIDATSHDKTSCCDYCKYNKED